MTTTTPQGPVDPVGAELAEKLRTSKLRGL